MSAGLTAHWQLDENVGTAAADSVDGMVGTLANGAQWGTGRSGSAAFFDGINDYLALPTFDVPATGLTLAAWVRSSAMTADTDQQFVSKASDASENGHYWALGVVSGERPRLAFHLRADGATTTLIASSGSVPVDTWYHVTATYDGTAMRLYLNGVLVGSAPKRGALDTSNSAPVAIGRHPTGTSHMRGAIDDVRIYRRALVDSEILAIVDGR